MILSNIFSSSSDKRRSIDKSSRYIMLVLLREIIKNRIEIEGLKKAVQTTITTIDSDGDSEDHDHDEYYQIGKSAAEAKWQSDLLDIAKKISSEENKIDNWDKAYKKKLDNTPRQSINGLEQMKTNSKKIKRYDYIDEDQ